MIIPLGGGLFLEAGVSGAPDPIEVVARAPGATLRLASALARHDLGDEVVDDWTLGVHGPVRTIIDTFRLRHREGRDVAIEALRGWVRAGHPRGRRLQRRARPPLHDGPGGEGRDSTPTRYGERLGGLLSHDHRAAQAVADGRREPTAIASDRRGRDPYQVTDRGRVRQPLLASGLLPPRDSRPKAAGAVFGHDGLAAADQLLACPRGGRETVLDSVNFDIQSYGMLIALNELQSVLYPSLAGGCLVGGALAWFAATRKSLFVCLPLLLFAVIAVWFSLAAGMHFGYGAWQGIDNPPEEAFADGADLTGSILFGWMPSGIFCALVFVLTRVVWRRRQSLAKAARKDGAAAVT